MMKASELMTGDYAQVNRDWFLFKKGKLVQILSIDNTGCLVNYSFNGLTGSNDVCDDIILESNILLKYLEPIPLTADILQKYGFKITNPSEAKHLQNYVFAGDYEDVYAKEINDGTWKIDVYCTEFDLPVQTAMVSHLHQLQNWFRLCGIEWNI